MISLLIVQPERLPTLASLQSEANTAGERLEFFEPADLTTHTGFLPMRVEGREIGFEYYYEAIPDGALPSEVTRFGSHHIVARTGASFEEGRAALTFLKVAARLTGGAYVYPDDETIVPPDEVQTYLSEQIAEYGKHIK